MVKSYISSALPSAQATVAFFEAGAIRSELQVMGGAFRVDIVVIPSC
jgi:hypothetical protein